MIHYKKMVILILSTAACLFFLTATASAERVIKVLIDGDQINFEEQPIIVDGTTLVPFRPVFEKLGLKVSWDNATKTVIGSNRDLEIKLIIDNPEAKVNGISKLLDISPRIINGNTFIPLRFIGESTGKEVSWYPGIPEIQIGKHRLKYSFFDGEYFGDAKHGLPNGEGTVTYFDGGKYIGEVKDGRRVGKGTMIWSNGDKYIGEFKDDEPYGRGIVYLHNGDRYEGDFVNSIYHGQGTYYFANGNIQKGTFYDGKFMSETSSGGNNNSSPVNSQGVITKEQALDMLNKYFEGMPAGIGHPTYKYVGTTKEGYYIFQVYVQGGIANGELLGTTYFNPVTGKVKSDFKQ